MLPGAVHGPVEVTDYHTAGEPFRIVTSGVPPIDGATVRERREHARTSDEVDAVRRLLVQEPRGHADMYGCFLVPPDDEGAHFGVLFWHKDGFSTACGHGTIALGAWAVRSGRVTADPDGTTEVVVDVPSGRVSARVTCRGGAVHAVTFRNVPSYPLARGVVVPTSYGEVVAGVSYGGAIYASVQAAQVGLAVDGTHYHDLISLGRQVKWALNDSEHGRHPSDARLDGVYGTILFDDLGRSGEGLRQRNVTVFADGEVDRSPCGSGTSARLALLADVLGDGTLAHESIVGTTFEGRVVGRTQEEGRAAVVTEVTGIAYETGRATFTLDPADGLGTGFVLR